MNKLSNLIDRLPPPQLPAGWSEQDRRMTLLALTSAKQQIRPYDGKFEAPWLLSPFSAGKWETTNRGREEKINGEWHNTICLDWNVPLPNGTSLTDVRNEQLLVLIKTIAFLMRSGLISGTYSPSGWRNSMGKLIGLVRWTVLHEKNFSPEKFGLRLLDQSSLEWLFSEVAKGGWFHAHQIPHRLLSVMYQGAHGISCPQPLQNNPFKIAPDELAPLVQWLESSDFYTRAKDGTHMGKRYIKRDPLAKLIGEDPWSFNSPYVSRFMRQFEPDFSDQVLLVALRQSTEFPSQKVGLVRDTSDGVASEEVIRGLEKIVTTVLDAHRHVPALLPEPVNISLRRATSIAMRIARPKSHTLFMPINTGLTYLNTAMRFVHVYGEAIVDFYLAVLQDFNPVAPNSSLNSSLVRRSNDWRIASGEPIASVLNITEFRHKEAKRVLITCEELRHSTKHCECLSALVLFAWHS